ncbi:MAG: DNA-directed RNA polymerase subunit omega [Planctomycetaceae bacterium]|jgi:DNA-directed RNA polymerase subunit omega|nr:DNA-directed RNA polymerase subunit omega [Planctomycetaceae bacterium]
MIEELKDEELIKKIGGRFKLSSLIQKRLVYLNKGAQAFVDPDKSASKDKLHVVINEILQDKIYLDMDGEVRERTPTPVEIVFDDEYTGI